MTKAGQEMFLDDLQDVIAQLYQLKKQLVVSKWCPSALPDLEEAISALNTMENEVMSAMGYVQGEWL